MASESVVMYSYYDELPTLDDIGFGAHTNVLVAKSRLDQARVRNAVDAVFAAHPRLGTVFEPMGGKWTSHPGGGWVWAVEHPGVAVADVVARRRRRFDALTGRLFAVSLLPGAPERLVLTASHLCIDAPCWLNVVKDLMTEYGGGVLRPKTHRS